MALTQEELDTLSALMQAGDRAGFYMAYYAMTGNPEAALQAKIATFSEAEGGFAYAANWLLTTAVGSQGYVPGTYPGIYALSQQVAASAMAAIQANVNAGGTGSVSGPTMFDSAAQAWSGAQIQNLFPGNLLGWYLSPGNSLTSFLSWGSLSSAIATLFASEVGKRLSDFAGYTKVAGLKRPLLYVRRYETMMALAVRHDIAVYIYEGK